MKIAPTLHTERLILRSFTREDAADVNTSDPDVASKDGFRKYILDLNGLTVGSTANAHNFDHTTLYRMTPDSALQSEFVEK